MSRLSPILAAGEVVGVVDGAVGGLGVLAGSTVPFDSSRPGTAATVSSIPSVSSTGGGGLLNLGVQAAGSVSSVGSGGATSPQHVVRIPSPQPYTGVSAEAAAAKAAALAKRAAGDRRRREAREAKANMSDDEHKRRKRAAERKAAARERLERLATPTPRRVLPQPLSPTRNPGSFHEKHVLIHKRPYELPPVRARARSLHFC